VKKYLLVLALLLLFACGKKDIPPSPDIFAPGITSVEYSINSQIKCTFSENISDKVDSVVFGIPGGSVKASSFFTDKNTLFAYCGDVLKIQTISIFGIRDKSENKKSFYSVTPKGFLFADTISPFILKSGYTKGRINVETSELIKKIDMYIFPLDTKYRTEITALGVRAIIENDTFNEPLQLLVVEIEDLAGNVNLQRYNKVFSENDSIYGKIIQMEGFATGEKVQLSDSAGRIIRAEYSDELGSIRFTNLKEGSYRIFSEKMEQDTFIK